MPESDEKNSEVRITDPYTVQLVEAEQARTGEKSLAKVAGRLIAERLAIRERSIPEQQSQAVAEANA